MPVSRPRAVVDVVPLSVEHADAVLDIYREGLATGNATFETTVPSWASWDAARARDHRWVALARSADEADPPALSHAAGAAPGDVLGWAACSPVSDRCVYAGVLEHSVYVAAAARGLGVGSALLRRLIESTEAAGVWTLQSGVFPENTASLALHERHGFRVVGRRERVGRGPQGWRDVLLLERRSVVAGT